MQFESCHPSSVMKLGYIYVEKRPSIAKSAARQYWRGLRDSTQGREQLEDELAQGHVLGLGSLERGARDDELV